MPKIDPTKSPESLYKVMAKVGDTPEKKAIMVVYRTRNLVSTFNFITKKFPGFRWMNVFDRETKEQLASFTKNNPPLTARIKK